ncbi:MAG: glycosyltransferase [Thermoplasmata archaeon]
MKEPDIVHIYDPSVPEGTGHGTVIRKLLPLIQEYSTNSGFSVASHYLYFTKFESKAGYYIKTWMRKFSLFPSGRIIHALDPGWATPNTNFLTYYDIWPLKFRKYGIKGIGDKIEWKMRILALKNAECILSISEWSKNELVEYANINPKKIRVVRLGIDHQKYYPVQEKGEFFSSSKINIVSAGSNEPRKNFVLVVKSLEYLRERGVEARFVRFGPTTWAEQKKEIEEIKMKKKLDVVEPGVVSEEVLRKHYSSCDVFVWPSIYIESLSTIEALACGAKVVVLDRVFNREFLSDVAVYVKNNDPKEFAEGIIEALKMDIKNKGIEHAKKYSWEKTASNYLEIYKEFLQER